MAREIPLALALWASAALTASGCVRAGYDPSRPGDAVGPGAPDAHPDAADPCQPPWRCTWTLEPPTYVAELSSDSPDYEPFLTPDCLTIYFASGRKGPDTQSSLDIWVAQRGDPTAPFETPRNHSAFNTANEEERYALTVDGTQVFVTTNRPGGEGLSDIWTAVRTAPGQSFGPLSPVSVLNSIDYEYDPLPSRDGLRLYFVSTDPPGSEEAQEIFVASRATPTSFFSPPVLVAGLATEHNEDNPALSADELFIIFTSSRPGGPGGGDLWWATRSDRDAPFSAPKLVPVVNGPGSEGEAFLACGDRELWFASDRRTKGVWDLYRSRFVVER
jgi:hypothetical protein